VLEQTGKPLSDWQEQWGWHGSGPREGRRGPAIVGLDGPAIEIDRRIEARTRSMLDSGWAAEAAAIRAGEGFGPTAAQALGYAEALRLADGEIDVEVCAAEIARRTKRFARRQRTWYRNIEGARWLRPAEAEGDLGPLAEAAMRALEEMG
jgi:tRNA dimethylallyltransferase